MMLLRTTSTLALLMLIVFVCSSASADSWGPPQKRNYYSTDKKYRLEVIPKLLEYQVKYFQDKLKKPPDAAVAEELKDNYARAIFYVNERTGYTEKSRFPLVNEIGPQNALVSADGNYIVTFDNWARVGIGDDIVVIYRSDGTLIKKFSLDDLFVKADIKSFFKTSSSIWWGRGHYLDDKRDVVQLKPSLEGRSDELSIDLASGQLLQPKSDPPR